MRLNPMVCPEPVFLKRQKREDFPEKNKDKITQELSLRDVYISWLYQWLIISITSIMDFKTLSLQYNLF